MSFSDDYQSTPQKITLYIVLSWENLVYDANHFQVNNFVFLKHLSKYHLIFCMNIMITIISVIL